MTTPKHVLEDARWLRENYDEQRSAQFMAAKRVRAICDALLAAADAEPDGCVRLANRTLTPFARGRNAAGAGQRREHPPDLSGNLAWEWLCGYDAAPPQRDRVELSDPCTVCGATIDHNEPHMVCDACREAGRG